MSEVHTLAAVLKRTAGQYPNHMAIEDGDLHLTYGQLHGYALKAARALISLGVGHGDKVAIWAPNGHEWVIAALGAQCVGAVLVPVNTRMKGPEVQYILSRSGAKVLFCVGQFLGVDYALMIRDYLPPSVQTVVCFGACGGDDRYMSWTDLLARAGACPELTLNQRMAQVQPDDVCDILFTSGTTGYPKGVMTSHQQNIRLYTCWGELVGLNTQDRYLIVNPFFHAFGYKAGWLACVIAGATMVPHAVFDSEAVLRRIQADRITVLPGPPTLFQTLLDHPGLASTDLSSLRAASTGASTIAPSLIEKMRKRLGFKVVVTAYGLTETCGLVTMCSPDDDAVTVATTCGRAIPGVDIQIVSPEGAVLAAGQPGEVCVRGHNVMLGYLDDTKASEDTVDADGWLHTGDVGILDEAGYLKITDRLKDLYIVGGFNCYPAEIEKLMSNHPKISQVAVIGVPDERMGEVGKAFVMLSAGQSMSDQELIQWCRDNMANYKVPRYVEFVTEFPCNASGKILKRSLRDLSHQAASCTSA